jgi:hypothetical protein
MDFFLALGIAQSGQKSEKRPDLIKVHGYEITP